MQAELESAINEFQEQIAVINDVLSKNPQNEEAQQILGALAEALSDAEAAYAACFPAVRKSLAVEIAQYTGDGYPERTQQHEDCQSGAAAAAHRAGAAAAPHTTEAPGAAALPHPGRSARKMHPANLYCNRAPDFAALAELHLPLAPYITVHPITGRASIDFTSWAATKELTTALLAVDFGVKWMLPEGQLVPPVPNRANYIHWMHDLLQLSAPPGALVRGLDIGCGANLIYCLLGAALYGWHMTGVDITEVACNAAAAIVEANPHLQALIEVRRSCCIVGQLPQQQQQQQLREAEDDRLNAPVLGPLLGAMSDEQEVFAFCMCNPPFFGSIREANQNPNTACGGTAEEMVVEGGELAFIRAMIADSQHLRDRVHWYSSMCGKKSSLKTLRQELHIAGVSALRTTELVQGKTSRWAIAWSFAASPNTASMPLPQRNLLQQQQPHSQQQQQQQSNRSRDINSRGATAAGASARELAFQVTAAAADGRKLLQSIAALLGAVANAQQVQVDSAAWRVTCMLQLAPAAQQEHSETLEQEQQLPALLQPTAGGSTDQPGGPPSKRLRTGADSSRAAFMSDSRALRVEVSVYQQHRSSFNVVALIKEQQQQRCYMDTTAFVTAFESVREDLTLMWPVSALQLL